MANGYYDCYLGTFNPYVIAGLGLAQISIHDEVNCPDTVSETNSGVGYQFGAGFEVIATKNIFIDVRSRYFGSYPVSLKQS